MNLHYIIQNHTCMMWQGWRTGGAEEAVALPTVGAKYLNVHSQ